IHATGDVGDGDARPGWTIGRTGQGDHPGFALQEQVVRLAVAVRAVRTVTRDGARDQAWVATVQVSVAAAEALGGTRALVVDEDVRAIQQQIERVPAPRLFQVQRDTAFATIEPHEMR